LLVKFPVFLCPSGYEILLSVAATFSSSVPSRISPSPGLFILQLITAFPYCSLARNFSYCLAERTLSCPRSRLYFDGASSFPSGSVMFFFKTPLLNEDRTIFSYAFSMSFGLFSGLSCSAAGSPSGNLYPNTLDRVPSPTGEV